MDQVQVLLPTRRHVDPDPERGSQVFHHVDLDEFEGVTELLIMWKFCRQCVCPLDELP